MGVGEPENEAPSEGCSLRASRIRPRAPGSSVQRGDEAACPASAENRRAGRTTYEAGPAEAPPKITVRRGQRHRRYLDIARDHASYKCPIRNVGNHLPSLVRARVPRRPFAAGSGAMAICASKL